MSDELDPEGVYREFDVRRRGFMRYEPVFICADEGELREFKTYVYFTSRIVAMRVSMLMRTAYNDGLWSGKTNILLTEYNDDNGLPE